MTAANSDVVPPQPTRTARLLTRLRRAALAIGRWRARQWLRLNRYQIELVACDARDLSESGQRLRAQTLQKLDEMFRAPGLRDLDPRR